MPITAIATFVATSLMIRYAGVDGYAAVVVVAMISQLVPFADLGIGVGVINVIATTAQGSPDRDRVVASALRLLSFSAASIVVGGLLLAAFSPWEQVLGIDEADVAGLATAAAVAVTLFACTVPLGIGQRILLGLGRNALSVILAALGPIVALAIVAGVVALNGPVAVLALAVPIGTLVYATACFAVGLRAVQFRWRLILDTSIRYAGLIRQGVWFVILSLTGASALHLGRVILASKGSLNEVAEYSLVLQLYFPIWSIFVATGTALWPVFARQRLEHEGIARGMLVRSVLVFSLLGAVAAAGLVALGPWFVGVLSSGAAIPAISVFAACGMLIVLQAVQLVLGVYLTGADDLRYQALWGIPMAITAVVGTWWTVPVFGAAAPFAMVGLSMLVFSIAPCMWRILGTRRLGDASAQESAT